MKPKTIFIIAPLLALLALAEVACHRDLASQPAAAADNDDVDYYTCTMHPSVRLHDPNGKCPICGMGVVPVFKQKSAAPGAELAKLDTNADALEKPREFVVPVARQQQIGVTYATVENRPLRASVRAVATIAYDKLRHWDYVSRVNGYVQQLFVSSRGDPVESNQTLLTIYSPDLLTTENEFLELLNMRDAAEKSQSPALLDNANRLIDSARRRLALWNISPDQIAALEKTRAATETLSLRSPFKGLVQSIPVDQGRGVAVGDHLVDVVDLSVVWAWAQFYQDELPLLKPGAPVTITSDACPGEQFTGKIALIDPFMNDQTRTARVRIDVQNPDFKLRPDMYVNVLLETDGGVGLAVPVGAVLPTGERNLVFVDKAAGKLEPRFVELGRKYGDFYAVASGLNEGERVVDSANFLIDAESKVQGALKSW